tara:strand:- start:237 stop:1238 length:1002 start_codon:yes stop_codon:yes gene_type:complete
MLIRCPGKNWPKISALGIGAMSFTDFYGQTDTNQSFEILKTAMDFGVNHIDTANMYGMGVSETRIGKFLSSVGKKDRNFFHIATKGGIKTTPGGPPKFDNSKDYLSTELDKSLQRLGVENIDLYYIHRRDRKTPIEEVVETLFQFKKAGKINQFGFSEISPVSLEKANNVHHVGAVQSEYSLSTRFPELGLLQKTKKLETAFIAFSPVGRGLLTDKPPTPERVKESPFLNVNPRFQEPNLSENIEAVKRFQKLAKDYGLSTAGLAIAWLIAKDDHIIPIPGTRSTMHLKEMIKGTEKNLNQSDINEIEKTLPVGWAHGDRYSDIQWIGPEKYC